MSYKELEEKMRGFIQEIKEVKAGEDAKNLQKRIHEFYVENDVPKEKDLLGKSGFCELLSMLAD